MVIQKGKSLVTFVYRPTTTCRKVEVAGSFNDWAHETGRMAKQRDGTYRKRFNLRAGEHRYRFVIDGQWADDPDADRFVANAFGTRDAVVNVAPGDAKTKKGRPDNR